MKFLLTNIIIVILLAAPLLSQNVSNEEIKRRIEVYKKDSKGPYKEIRWFCKDGTMLPPQERCPEPGGVQRANYKDEVTSLALSNHILPNSNRKTSAPSLQHIRAAPD